MVQLQEHVDECLFSICYFQTGVDMFDDIDHTCGSHAFTKCVYGTSFDFDKTILDEQGFVDNVK